MELFMKKLTLVLIAVFMATSAFSADKKKSAEDYIKDLDPSKDEKVIVEAADFLGKEKEKDAVKKLQDLLKDQRVNVRLHAVIALGYIGQEESAESLNGILLNDESPNVRYAAVLSISRIGSKKSIDALKEAKAKESDPFILDFLKKMEEKIKGK